MEDDEIDSINEMMEGSAPSVLPEKGKSRMKRAKKAEVSDSQREEILNGLKNYVYIASGSEFLDIGNDDRMSAIDWYSYYQGFLGLDKLKIQKMVLNHEALLTDDDGSPIAVPVFKMDRYQPGAPTAMGGGYYNTWTQPAEPEEYPEGAMDLLLDHVREHFPDGRDYSIFMDYLYFTLAEPERKMLHALLVTGEQGTGKSLLCKGLPTAVLGKKEIALVSSKELESDFDRYKSGYKVVYIDELKVAHSKVVYNNIKDLISELRTSVNEKYRPVREVDLYVNVMATSNYQTPIKLENNDRRWTVLRSALPKPTNEEAAEKYPPLWKFVKDNPSWIMHYFKNVYEPSGIVVPEGATMTDAKMAMLEDSESYIAEPLDLFISWMQKVNKRIFTIRTFKSYVRNHADFKRNNTLQQLMDNPANVVQCFYDCGIPSLGKRTSPWPDGLKGKYTSEKLFGLPGEDYSGMSITDLWREYSGDSRSKSKLVSLDRLRASLAEKGEPTAEDVFNASDSF